MNTIVEIKGYEGLYYIDTDGNIYNKSYEKLSPHIYKTGYNRVTLYKNKIGKHFLVHRLVGLTFIENINNYPQINHIDGNKSNNKANNLERCTASLNQTHSRQVLGNLVGEKNPMYGRLGRLNHKSKQINQYALDGKFIRSRECAEDVKRKLGIDQSCVIKCCRGRRNKTGGFKWSYK